MRVFVIPADATRPIVEHDAPGDDDNPDFATWCRETLDGYLELHSPRAFPRSGIKMWLDEDAKMKQKSPNIRATRIALLAPHDFIAGDAVVTGSRGPSTAACPLLLEDIVAIVDAFMNVPQSGRVE